MKTSTLFSLTFLLAAALNTPRLAPQTYAQAARSTVRGRVVYADTGNPVRRAQVFLQNAATGEQAGQTVTDVKGEFVINHLPAGRYFVAADAPNLIDPSVIPRQGVDTHLLDLAESQELLTEVELDGNRSADLVIRARRGGAITGRVTSEDDEPVAGAQLKLFRLRQGELARVAATWQVLDADMKFLTTDSRGVYRIAGLLPGEYIVRASESDLGGGPVGEEGDAYGDGSLVVAYFPSAVAVKDAAPVRVYEGRDTDKVDIRIPERPTRKLGGVVTLKRGGRALGATEITVSRKDEGAYRPLGFVDESARTDVDGRWEVAGVPDGEYVVTVQAAISFVSDGSGGTRSVQVAPLRREVVVNGGDLTDLKFELEEGSRISGTASVEGGKALPERLWVEALRNGEEVDTAFVRDDGRFEFDNVPAGDIRLRVSGFPEDRFYAKSLTLNQKNLMQEPVRVGAGASVEGVRVVLSSDLITVKGLALSRRDGTSPLAGAFVVLVPSDERVRRASAARPRVVRADAKGRFETAAGPGEYLLVALPAQAPLRRSIKIDEEFIRRSRATLTRVTLKAGENVTGVKVLSSEESP